MEETGKCVGLRKGETREKGRVICVWIKTNWKDTNDYEKKGKRKEERETGRDLNGGKINWKEKDKAKQEQMNRELSRERPRRRGSSRKGGRKRGRGVPRDKSESKVKERDERGCCWSHRLIDSLVAITLSFLRVI